MSEEQDWVALSEEWARYRGWEICEGTAGCGWEPGLGLADGYNEAPSRLPFAGSVDALLASLPENWFPDISAIAGNKFGQWCVVIKTFGTPNILQFADTAAHALLLACLDVAKQKQG